jgi:YD repeat-containing protein
MLVVDRIDTWDELSEEHDVDTFAYRNGFYDGVEKQFRGYAEVVQTLVGDEDHEEGTQTVTFDVGQEDAYRHGPAAHESVQTSGGRTLSRSENEYEDCPVAEVPANGCGSPCGICARSATTTVLEEGRPAAEHVTLETREHPRRVRQRRVLGEPGRDANRRRRLPRVPRRPRTRRLRRALRAMCLGDESSPRPSMSARRTRRALDLGAATRTRSFGRAGSPLVSETLNYYDGPDFEGLPLGQLTHGKVSRTTVAKAPASPRSTSAAMPSTTTAMSSPRSTPSARRTVDTHRREYTYDAEGLRVVTRTSCSRTPRARPTACAARHLRAALRQGERVDGLDAGGERPGALAAAQQQLRLRPVRAPHEARAARRRHAAEPDRGVRHTSSPSPVSRILVRQAQPGGRPSTTWSPRAASTGAGGRSSRARSARAGALAGHRLHGLRPPQHAEGRFSPSSASTASVRRRRRRASRAAVHLRRNGPHRLTATEPDAEDLYGTPSVSRTSICRSPRVFAERMTRTPAAPTRARRRRGRRRPRPHWSPSSVCSRRTAPGRGHGALRRPRAHDRLHDPAGHREVADLRPRRATARNRRPQRRRHAASSYDDAGNLLTRTDARGETVAMAYDGANRPVARWNPEDEAGSRVTMRYDGCDARSAATPRACSRR